MLIGAGSPPPAKPMDPCDGIIVAVQASRVGQSNDWRKIYAGVITISNNGGSTLQLPNRPLAVTLSQSSGKLVLQATSESCGGISLTPKDFAQCSYYIVGPKMTSVDGGPETSIFNTVQATVEVFKGVKCSSYITNFGF